MLVQTLQSLINIVLPYTHLLIARTTMIGELAKVVLGIGITQNLIDGHLDRELTFIVGEVIFLVEFLLAKFFEDI